MNSDLTPKEQAAVRLGSGLSSVIRAGFLVKQAFPPPVTGLEHGALPVLFTIQQQPRRVSEIAAACHTDVSTTSRHVTTLTRLGLVTKVPDEHDRRASVVTLTDQGTETTTAIRRQRAEIFAKVLHDWDLDDVHRLSDELERLAASVDTYLTTTRHTKGA